ncbi:MAG: hypothetical protein DIZ80_01815 [endosymbiont of Galathealinum brachiosum]|uniref:Uncharacterized protein n=1 Tax=endosymbiont of Galathealinum brachiosum TaxID=2200906 RepID=A0A370DLC3_9GAMM|nr:MAG: hypothetical protein DIZ80_01815 [endosymbiont of Galathealinum brachiosum]
MSNLVKASVVFCYKGKTHSASITIELDEYLQVSDTLPELYPIIAKANNYDLYSYEFEMMQAQSIVFSEATGLVAEFITDGLLDIEAFVQAWKDLRCMDALVKIADDVLSVDDLEKNLDLKRALLEAYRLGQASCVSESSATDPLLEL